MPLLLLTSFLAGLVLGSYCSFIPFFILCVLILLAVSVTWCERIKLLTVLEGGLLYACLLIGVLYWVVVDESHVKSLLVDSVDTHTVTLRGTVVQPVRHLLGKVVMTVEVSTVERNRTLQTYIEFTSSNMAQS